eukprot:2087023-Amphidinium_carterae.1
MDQTEPVVEHGLVEPVLGVLIGCWWLLREIELATVRKAQLKVVSDGSGCGSATLELPASKTDHLALGKS